MMVIDKGQERCGHRYLFLESVVPLKHVIKPMAGKTMALGGCYDNSSDSSLGSDECLWYFGEWSILLIWPQSAYIFSFLFKDCPSYLVSFGSEMMPSPSMGALSKVTDQHAGSFHYRRQVSSVISLTTDETSRARRNLVRLFIKTSWK